MTRTSFCTVHSESHSATQDSAMVWRHWRHDIWKRAWRSNPSITFELGHHITEVCLEFGVSGELQTHVIVGDPGKGLWRIDASLVQDAVDAKSCTERGHRQSWSGYQKTYLIKSEHLYNIERVILMVQILNKKNSSLSKRVDNITVIIRSQKCSNQDRSLCLCDTNNIGRRSLEIFGQLQRRKIIQTCLHNYPALNSRSLAESSGGAQEREEL